MIFTLGGGCKKRCPPIDPGWGVDHIGGTLGGKVVVSTIEAAQAFVVYTRFVIRHWSIRPILLAGTKRSKKSGHIEEIPSPIVVEVCLGVLGTKQGEER